MSALAILTLFASLPQALAWSTLRVEGGATLSLQADNPWVDAPYLPLAANTRNNTGILPEELFSATVRGLQRWQQASSGTLQFDYWQGDDPETFSLSFEEDGLSTLLFASTGDLRLGAGHAAYTRLWYDPDTFAISEVDIVLNDVDYAFTTDPSLTTYTEEGQLGKVVFLEDVITHELGHALGLGHSGLLQSTLFTWSWADQQHLGCDDIAAAQALYAPGALEASTARLRGRVEGPDGAPLMGAQLSLISRDRGGVEQAVLSEADGSFRIEAVPPGDWILLLEPIFSEAESLSEYYAGLDHRICGGELFSRSFMQETPGSPSVLNLSAGQELDLGSLAVSCDADMGLVPLQAGPSVDQALSVHTDADGAFALLDVVVPTTGERFYRLQGAPEPLVVDLLSYSLFSPAWVHALVLDQAGDPLQGVIYEEPSMEEIDRGTTLWDTRLYLPLPKGEEAFLVLESDLLDPNLYPRGDLYVDETPFVLALGRPERTESTSCEPGEELPEAYASPSGDPRRRDLPADENGESCGCASTPGSPLTALTLLLLQIPRRRRIKGSN